MLQQQTNQNRRSTPSGSHVSILERTGLSNTPGRKQNEQHNGKRHFTKTRNNPHGQQKYR